MTSAAVRENDSRTVLLRIREARPGLRPSELAVADVLLDDPDAAANLSIAELAERSGTSTTSVVRFYRSVGYTRYQDLRLDLAQEAARERLQSADRLPVSGDIDPGDTLTDIISKIARSETLSISDTAEVLDTAALGRAITAILAARRIDIFGVGAGSIVGLDLQQKLTRIGLTALVWPDSHAALTTAAVLDERCVALAVSHSGTTTDTVDYLNQARSRGATTIALTNFSRSPLTAAADIVLLTAARETLFRSGALGSRIAQLAVVDCLFIGVAQASYDSSVAALQQTYRAVRGHRLPLDRGRPDEG
ncbi:MurR/RpiR family transcriptional regulator [Actinotalea sp.]|uniref:MurR/RpiR family transcriptional regulator n=1 Tax=Actinotalea sp. TaxID=1872145 RepID=UPI003568A101